MPDVLENSSENSQYIRAYRRVEAKPPWSGPYMSNHHTEAQQCVLHPHERAVGNSRFDELLAVVGAHGVLAVRQHKFSAGDPLKWYKLSTLMAN